MHDANHRQESRVLLVAPVERVSRVLIMVMDTSTAITGSRPLCICRKDETLYYGEYCNNPERRPVRIFASHDQGASWPVIYSFDDVRHVHGIFHDEYTFPNASMLFMNLHEASKDYFKEKKHYYEEHYSFWIAQSLNRLQNFTFKFILPLVTLFAFFIEVFIPTYNLYTRRDLDKWYYTINEIDTEIENLNFEDAKGKREVVHDLFLEIRRTDDIPATHMELFYTLQNQMVNVLNSLDEHIATCKDCSKLK